MYYTIYQTTNKVNGKIYVGSHKTEDINDDYIGSGKMLNYAIDKYGIDNFEKTVLFVFENPDHMYEKEKEIVNEEFVKSPHTYNMKIGGYGGWDHVDNTGRFFSEETRQKMSSKGKERVGEKNSFWGKKHKSESLKIISETSKARGKTIYEKRLSDGNHPNSFGNCPHCGKHGQLRAMKRWHFDNCKVKEKTFQ